VATVSVTPTGNVPGANAAKSKLPINQLKEYKYLLTLHKNNARNFANPAIIFTTAGKPEAKQHGVEIPEIGRWYRDPNGNLFEVVAVDDQDGTIEMQHFDGTLEESEPEGWLARHAETAAAPEDWSGSVDINQEDIPDSTHPIFLDWKAHIDVLDDAD
jgi:hypothetical protein